MKPEKISFKEALKFWTKLGFISFGGPAGQIAIMHSEVVERKKWIGENQFLRALNFCMLLPGPEAQQLATYLGWRMHGILGGIAAGALFVIPSFFLMLLLSWLAVAHIDVPYVSAAFYGIQPVVVAVVIEAVFRIGKKALKHNIFYIFSAAAFIGIFFFKLPFPLIVGSAAAAGLILQKFFPAPFCSGYFDQNLNECVLESESTEDFSKKISLTHVLKVFLVCFILWISVVGIIWGFTGINSTLSSISVFFTKAAFVTFGGAYAVLSYIAEVSTTNGWLTMEQMLIGLGLAESTPGPLIMVTQYVGFLGAWNIPQGLTPITSGILGAMITTYVTFLPCFFFIFAGAPFIEAMAGNTKIQAALKGVTAAVVGVILNLAVWFGYKIFFPQTGTDYFAVATAAISLVLLQKYHFPIQYMVPIGAVTGIIWKVLI